MKKKDMDVNTYLTQTVFLWVTFSYRFIHGL